MRILVTGAGGQLGRDLVLACARAGDDVIACDRAVLDLADRGSVHRAILEAQPEVIVNSGAWTAVDACEADPERAHTVNGMGPGWVVEAARQVGAHVVQISTDYVFDGTKAGPYLETDPPNPLSVYGASKLEGERAMGDTDAIVRTAWVCGEHGANMVKTVLALADRPSLAFVDDQRGCPSFTADLAVTIRRLAADRLAGTFHVTNQGETTWYGFVREVLELTGQDPDKVRPITTAELDPPRPAPRPANSVLANAALEAAGLPLLPHYRASLERLLVALGARA